MPSHLSSEPAGTSRKHSVIAVLAIAGISLHLVLRFGFHTAASAHRLPLLAVLIVVVALWRKWRLEERWLVESFGAAYAEYRRTTWALIPFIL